MDHGLDPAGSQEVGQRRGILHAQFVEREPADVVLMPAREIVNDDHVVSVPFEQVCGVRADVASAARNKNRSHNFPL